MKLEGLATGTPPRGMYPFDILESAEGQASEARLFEQAGLLKLLIDTRPLIAAVVADVRGGCSRSLIARRFHSTMVDMIAQVCGRLRRQTGLATVALSGGVFM